MTVIQELQNLRRAANAIAAHTGHHATVTKMQRLGDNTDYLETEWQVFAWSRGNEFEVAYMACSKVSTTDVINAFANAQCSYIETLDKNLLQAKEAYEQALNNTSIL